MNIADYQISKIPIIIMLVLFLGIIIGVYLVQRQQILKSKASGEEIYEQIDITASEENLKETGKCFGEGNTFTCETESDEVQIDISNLLP